MKFRVIIYVVIPAALLVYSLVAYVQAQRILEDQRALRDRTAIVLEEAKKREEARVRLMKFKDELHAKQRNFCENVKHGIAFDHPDTWQTICVDPKGIIGTYYFEKDFK